MGAVYAIVIDGYGDATVIELISENSVSLLWQLPQYFCLTVGEVLFSVTGLEFSYSQATSNMKSVMQVIYSIQVIMILQALWLMTVFFGNIIAMSISGTHIISDASTEFFLYALLMLAVMCLFMILATRYEYVKEDDQHQQSIDLVDQNKNNNN
jgi:dipeptide/tripeptide permease